MRPLINYPAALAGILFSLAGSGRAQIFRLTGGASSGYQAQGAGFEVNGKGYQGWTGAGIVDGKVIFGSYVKVGLHGYTFKAGSDSLVMTLPIDIFGTQSTLYTNGLSVEKKLRGTNYHIFAGQMGTTFFSPMFRAGTSSGPVTAIVFADRLVDHDLRIFTKNIFSTSQTSISGIEWRPCATSSSRLATVPLLRELKGDQSYGCTFAFAGGVGSGHGYTTESLSLIQPRVNLNLAYVSAADGFQRAVSSSGTSPQSELGGANVTGSLVPTNSIGIGFGHQNYVIPQQGNLPTLRVTVDRLSGGWKRWGGDGPSIGTSLFRSTMESMTTSGASVWVSQSVGSVDLRFNYLVSAASGNPSIQTFSLTTQEKLSPRISALEVTTYSQGKTSVAFGGGLLSNLMTLAVNYQTLYVPSRPTNPFTQALAVSLNLNLRGNLKLSTATSFTPGGKMVYTLAGTESYYRLAGLEAAPPMENFRMQPYLIQGLVTYPDGHPISGAAIRIGKEVVYSDQDGRFFAREHKPGRYKVEVDLGAFLADGTFTVISVPDDAAATKDETAAGITIVLNRR
jgi:hypothetical protein